MPSEQVQKVIEEVKQEFQHGLDVIKQDIQTLGTQLKGTPPIDFAVTGGVCFVISFFFRIISKASEEDMITFGFLLDVVIFTLVTEIVHCHQGALYWFHQYADSLVVFSFFYAVGLYNTPPLVLAAFPLLINYTRSKVVPLIKQAKE